MDLGYEIVSISRAARSAVEEVLMDAVGGDDLDMRQVRMRTLTTRGDGFAVLSAEEVIAAVVGHKENATWVIDAIGTGRSQRGHGAGRRLIEMLAAAHPDKTLVAETDDDAVEFYRATGFLVELLPARWPGVNRYLCSRHPRPQDPQITART